MFDESMPGHTTEGTGKRVGQPLSARLVASGVDTSEIEWLAPDESGSIVRHWVNDLGAERYGQLALIAPPSGSTRAKIDGALPPWLARDSFSVFVLFSDYRTVGIARCSWTLVLANAKEMALADGDGFCAVTDEMHGVLIVDVVENGNSKAIEVEAWGDVVRIGGPQ